MSDSSSPSSTFWIIDTTSVSDTFTTTATFTLWVPLNTPPAATSPSASPEATVDPGPRSSIPVIAGSVIGSLLGSSLIFTCLLLYYKRRIKRKVVQPRTKAPNTPYGSEHALLDLTAEPAPHPGNIEPWVAPTVVRRSNKVRDQDSSAPRAEDAPRVESLAVGALGVGSSERRTQSNRLVQPVETPHSSAAPGSTNYGHGTTSFHLSEVNNPLSGPDPTPPQLRLHQHEVLPAGAKSTAVPRRRAPREPSPPRLEEDAGVSLMRAGDDVLPPSYGDLVHERIPGPGQSYSHVVYL